MPNSSIARTDADARPPESGSLRGSNVPETGRETVGLLGRGEVDFTGAKPARVYNMKLAAWLVTNTQIASGHEFSFNDLVGEVSPSTGFKPTDIIVDGRRLRGLGGGVCLVSTAVFRGALFAGLPITMRTAHGDRLTYYERGLGPGYDATVMQPGIDLRFVNDMPHDIAVHTDVDDVGMKLRVDICGVSDGRVTIVSEPSIVVERESVGLSYKDTVVHVSRTVTVDGRVRLSEVFESHYRSDCTAPAATGPLSQS